ncbi:MAG: mitofilin family membrane protein [Magnetospirillum sp. WYHS-4]
MTHKHEIPGVDPEALDDLAKQFPPAAAKIEPEQVRPQTVIIRKRAWFALLLAFLALVGAAASLAMPTFKPWLKANYGQEPVVAFLIGPRSEIEILKDEMNGLRGQIALLASRTQAGETNVTDTATRLGRIEKATEGLAARVETLAAPVPSGAMPAAPAEIEAWGNTIAKRVEMLESGINDAVGRLTAFETRIITVNKRLEAFDAVGGNIRTVTERLNGTESGLAGLQAQMAEVGTATGNLLAGLNNLNTVAGAIDQRLAALEGLGGASEGRLAALEGGVREDRGLVRAIRLAVAIQQLGTLSQTHKPFAREVEQVRRLAGDQAGLAAALDRLNAHSDTGVATVAELRDSFSAILVPKLRALADGGDRPWSDRMREWVSSAIAPTGPRPADRDPNLKLIDGTVQKLAEDDLKGAIDVLTQLEGPPATLAQRWLVEARARLAVDAATEGLAGLALDLIGRKS